MEKWKDKMTKVTDKECYGCEVGILEGSLEDSELGGHSQQDEGFERGKALN